MFDRARRATGGKGRAAGQIVIGFVWMRCNLDAHQRNADKIADLFLFDQAHGFFCIPFGHHHQLATNREALQHEWHRCRHVKQRHIHQCGRLTWHCGADGGQYLKKDHRLTSIAHRALHHRAVIGNGTL